MDRLDHDGLRHGGLADTETPVSLGYDRIRFTAPVFLGDTIIVTYTRARIDPCATPLRKQDRGGQPAGRDRRVGEHILKWVPKS